MNRQMRRMNEKSERRREKTSRDNNGKNNQTSNAKNRRLLKQARAKTKNNNEVTPQKVARLYTFRQNMTGILALLTVGLIVSSSLFPTESESPILPYFMLFIAYGMLGYFATLWLKRRTSNQNQNRIWAHVGMSAVGLAMVLQTVAIFMFNSKDILTPYVSLPGALLGTFIAYKVYGIESNSSQTSSKEK